MQQLEGLALKRRDGPVPRALVLPQGSAQEAALVGLGTRRVVAGVDRGEQRRRRLLAQRAQVDAVQPVELVVVERAGTGADALEREDLAGDPADADDADRPQRVALLPQEGGPEERRDALRDLGQPVDRPDGVVAGGRQAREMPARSRDRKLGQLGREEAVVGGQRLHATAIAKLHEWSCRLAVGDGGDDQGGADAGVAATARHRTGSHRTALAIRIASPCGHCARSPARPYNKKAARVSAGGSGCSVCDGLLVGALGAGPLHACGIATALVTGDQNAVAEEDAEAMRRSGLAHLLSISGFHVGLLAGWTMLEPTELKSATNTSAFTRQPDRSVLVKKRQASTDTGVDLSHWLYDHADATATATRRARPSRPRPSRPPRRSSSRPGRSRRGCSRSC